MVGAALRLWLSQPASRCFHPRFYRNRIVSVVYDAEFEIDYSIPDSPKNYSFARSIRIAEVQNPGKPSEREYPAGKDHGYNFDSRWVERDGGA